MFVVFNCSTTMRRRPHPTFILKHATYTFAQKVSNHHDYPTPFIRFSRAVLTCSNFACTRLICFQKGAKRNLFFRVINSSEFVNLPHDAHKEAIQKSKTHLKILVRRCFEKNAAVHFKNCWNATKMQLNPVTIYHFEIILVLHCQISMCCLSELQKQISI